MKGWKVFLHGVHVDTVFFVASYNETDVLNALAAEGWGSDVDVEEEK